MSIRGRDIRIKKDITDVAIEKARQEAEKEALRQENERNKLALQTLEQTEKDKVAALERASKAEQELAELKAQLQIATKTSEETIEALKTCRENLIESEVNCHDQFADLIPVQIFEEF